MPGTSRSSSVVTNALLAQPEFRLWLLMPFVHSLPGSLTEGITIPPGHMQKL